MSAEVETMFSARLTPWHGLGTVVEDALTAKEALSTAGLDWLVELVPLQALSPRGGKPRLENRVAVMRDIDDAVLGIVSPMYNVFQNHEAFEFLDILVGSGQAIFETAGSLRDGKVIFITLKIPNSVMIGGSDPHDLYIVLTTNHDGKGSVKVLVTPVRVVCMNTLTMAINGAKNRWSVAHNRTMKGRIQEARETLDLTFAYMEKFQDKAEELLAVSVTDDQFYDIVQDMFQPHNKDTEPATEIVMDLWENSPTNGFRGNGWGAFNSFTEFFEHKGRQRSLEARYGAIVGWQEKFRARATERILELA